MPRVLSYTPPWLSRPTPGFEVFAAKQKQAQTNGSSTPTDVNVASRTIALRGTEVFVAVGNEIRWSDLAWLKEIEEEKYEGQAYRVLKAGVHGEIKQVVISPLQDHLAIVTSHTVHVLCLPDSRLLTADDTTPLKPKIFQIGPTAHVVEEAPIVSVLWHPLGELGRCLVTVTRDAILRLWEINQDNKQSFAEASLSVDLKKLANAASSDEDLRASRFGAGKTYTPDLAFLEPAAVCFGANTPTTRNPWALMTLWIATVDGDVYALCPLLPKKWQPFDGMMESLFLHAGASEDQGSGDLGRWFLDLHDQDPLIIQARFETFTIYNRPRRPGPVPRLQGPFLLDPVPKDDFDLADIYVAESAVATKDNIEYEEEEEDEAESDELSSSLIYLLTTNATVQICVDTEGVEAQWLPSGTPFSTPSAVPMLPEQEPRALLTLETIELYPNGQYSSSIVPSFTPDVISPHAVFITHGTGVSFLSLAKWAERLQQELEQSAQEGSDLRYDILLSGPKALLEHTMQLPDSVLQTTPLHIATTAVIQDSDVGYMLLTLVNSQPFAAQLDLSHRDASSLPPFIKPEPGEEPSKPLSLPREPYHENPIFFDDTVARSIPDLLSKLPAHQRSIHSQEIRLSESSLAILVSAHQRLAAQTARVADAAGDLFRRCEWMQKEFRHQIELVDDVAVKIDALTGDYDDVGGGEGEGPREVGTRRIEMRLERARERQRGILERFRRLRGDVAGIDGRVLSDREKGFGREVRRMAEKVGVEIGEGGEEQTELQKRHRHLKAIKEDLARQAEEVGESKDGEKKESPLKVSSGFRRERERGVMELLEREEALLEAVTERANRLSVQQ